MLHNEQSHHNRPQFCQERFIIQASAVLSYVAIVKLNEYRIVGLDRAMHLTDCNLLDFPLRYANSGLPESLTQINDLFGF